MPSEKQVLEIPDFLTVRELADLMHASPIVVMKELITNGIMASINQQLDFDTAAIVLDSMGFEARQIHAEAAATTDLGDRPEWRNLYQAESRTQLQLRPAVVTVLGHVDHGKTSLLDRIRHTNVQEGEAGGITQHIGAYQVVHNGRTLTFLDTPGHEAFTAMRSRGARGADIAVLVVAADDGVMPTTREALSHVRAAGVPVVVALNKVDKPNSKPDWVKQQLAEELDLRSDEWGGNTLVVPVSAKTGAGIDNLLEAVVLVAEETEITANPTAKAAGTVLEGRMENARGVVATLLVQNGTLHSGDVVVAGQAQGRIKRMFDYTGAVVTSAGPSMPVSVMGLSQPPHAGDLFEVVDTIKGARATAEIRRMEQVQHDVRHAPGMTLEDVFARFKAGDTKELLLIIKVDVDGSLEPVVRSVENLEVSEMKVKVLHAGVGEITENDINLAYASNAIVIGFNVGADSAAERIADSVGVDIRTYSVIYKLIESVELALHGLLEPEYQDKRIGVVEVRAVFRIPKQGQIAGCFVQDGIVRRNSKAKVLRGRTVLVENTGVSSLKRFEEDVREVRTGFECGIGLDGFEAFQPGDRIEFYVRERVN